MGSRQTSTASISMDFPRALAVAVVGLAAVLSAVDVVVPADAFMFPVEEPLRIGWTDQIEFINGSAAVHANGRKYFLGLENKAFI